VVERDLAKVEVAGSTPVSRSNYLSPWGDAWLFSPQRGFCEEVMLAILLGAVPKW